jgi:hypothetical protein
MFKNRNILILVVVLAVLLGVNLWQRADHRSSTQQSSTVKVVAATITADQLDRITLGQGDASEAVDLVATPTGWVLASAWDSPANQQRIDALLRSVSDLSGEFRSDNESVLSDYSLSAETAVQVRAYGKDGELALALDVGGKPENSTGSFISMPGTSAVYLTQTNLLANLGLYDGPGIPDNKHFLDLMVLKEDRLAVDAIKLTEDGLTRELVKEFALEEVTSEGEEPAAEPALDRTTWEWKMTAPESAALAKTKADGLLGGLVSVRAVEADDPAGDMARYGLDAPSRTATMVMEGGSEVTLEFGNTREATDDLQAGVWMKVRGKPGIWVVTDYTLKNIFKPTDELVPDQE